MSEYRQLDIYWVNLDPTVGRETRKTRPCVIIQSDAVNKASQTVIVAPLLPNHKPWPFAVSISPTKQNGLDKDRHINLKQLRVVDIARLANKQGVLEVHYLPAIKKALTIVFDL